MVKQNSNDDLTTLHFSIPFFCCLVESSGGVLDGKKSTKNCPTPGTSYSGGLLPDLYVLAHYGIHS